jgi:hypothetical protein
MKSRNCFLRLGILACAVAWSGAVWAQTERVKLRSAVQHIRIMRRAYGVVVAQGFKPAV